MKEAKESSVVRSAPDILGGTPVFVGTRVPVQAFMDYIEGGHSLTEFLDDFPHCLSRSRYCCPRAGEGRPDRGWTVMHLPG